MSLSRLSQALAATNKSYAIDVEFIKTRGLQYARSIAIIPMFALPVTSGTCDKAVAPPTSALTGFELRSGILLSLQSDVVRREAEALPAGHAILPLLQSHIVKGSKLEDIATQHTHVLSTQQAVEKGETEVVDSDAEEDQKLISSFVESTGPAGNQPQRTPAEKEDRSSRRLQQIRLSIPSNFETFDPYSFPNIEAFPANALHAIYDDAVESSSFTDAVKLLMRLRAYGKGRSRLKSLSFVLQMLPEFARDVLHASFGTSGEWVEFIRACQRTALEEVERINAFYRSQSDAGSDEQGGERGKGATGHHTSITYRECSSLEELSEELNKEWSRILFSDKADEKHTKGRAPPPSSRFTGTKHPKFYAYGSVDNTVIKRTLALSCGNSGSGSTQVKAGVPSSPRALSWSDLCPVQLLPTDRLATPHQARVIDITSHTLYAAAGFLPSSRRKISLSHALEKASVKDATARELMENARPHDPVWDAQALGCVCVACGAVN